MSSVLYDTVEGIAQQVKTLEGLHRWITARHEAGYDRNEHLNEFIVLGRWVTDTCGNVGNILEMEPKLDLSPVVNMEELRKLVKVRMSWNGMGPSIPPLGAKCVVCGDGWTLENVHENHVERVYAKTDSEKDTWRCYHNSCWKLHQLKEEHDHFTEIFKNAGFNIAVLSPTENQYTRDSWGAPWFHVDTMIGRFLIGWRKRVIHIDWTAINRDCSSLFEEVQDTKAPHYIHAYSPEKASNYLSRIRVALEPATAREFEIWSEFNLDGKFSIGWNKFLGKQRGVDFIDACDVFFTKNKDIDYWKHENKYNGARLFPTEADARNPPSKREPT